MTFHENVRFHQVLQGLTAPHPVASQPVTKVAAAVTITMGEAIIYGSGRYPNDRGSYYLWQRPLP